MRTVRSPIVELRQYTLHPGQRDVLIELFDRALVEPQEADGMAVLGQFRDLDNPDRFVWLRGFADMPGRAESLQRFYHGPVWRAHAREANATMIDSDDVLLLRPVSDRSGFPTPAGARPAPDAALEPPALILATVYHGDRPFDAAFADFFERELRPALADSGTEPLAWLQTEYAENTFPALPVRTGEHVFVWFARLPHPSGLDELDERLAHSRRWRDRVLPVLSTMLTAAPQRLRLVPTARSLLR